MIYPFALAFVVTLNAQWAIRRWVLPWWDRRQQYVEQCEVCSRWLTQRQVRELRSDADDDGTEPFGFGGTAMIATYCRKHFPRAVDSSRVPS